MNTSNLREAVTIIELVQKEQKVIEMQDLCQKAINLIQKTVSLLNSTKDNNNSHCADFDHYGKQNREYWKDKEMLCNQPLSPTK